MRKAQLLFINLVLRCVSQICEIRKKKKVLFSLRTGAYIYSWEAHTQHVEESTSGKFTIQIFERQEGEASLRRIEIAHYYRQRKPVLD